MEQLSWGAAKTFKENEWKEYMKVILGEEEGAHTWLMKEPKESWARAFFDWSCKCDKLTDNFSESFNAWILKIRDKPLVQFIDKYIMALTALFNDRRMLSRELQSGEVVPKVMHVIEKYKRKYHKYTVEGVSDSVFCALNRYGKKYFVDIVKHTCSYIEWQVSGIPCIHAVAVITPRREPGIRYCSPFYSVDSFRATYQGYIFPLQNQEDWKKGNEIVKPPHVDRQPGRPKQMRIRDDDEPVSKAKRECQKCKSTGHNTRTCERRSVGIYAKRKGKGPAPQKGPPEGVFVIPPAKAKGAKSKVKGAKAKCPAGPSSKDQIPKGPTRSKRAFSQTSTAESQISKSSIRKKTMSLSEL